MCEISCKNSERLLRKWQITLGDTFFCRTLYVAADLFADILLEMLTSSTSSSALAAVAKRRQAWAYCYVMQHSVKEKPFVSSVMTAQCGGSIWFSLPFSIIKVCRPITLLSELILYESSQTAISSPDDNLALAPLFVDIDLLVPLDAEFYDFRQGVCMHVLCRHHL